MLKPIEINNLYLNVTTQCNQACLRCYNHLTISKETDMNMDTAMRATRLFLNSRGNGCDDSFIMFFGGEPLLNWKLCVDYVQWFRKNHHNSGIGLNIFTNGIDLSKDKADFLVENDVFVTFSLNGPYEQHALKRQIPLKIYNQVIENMDYIRSKKSVLPYCVFQRDDLKNASSILSFIIKLGYPTIAISKDFGEIWSAKERTQLISQLERVKNSGLECEFSFFPEAVSDCSSCYPRSMVVYPNMEVYDLCHLCATVQLERGTLNEKELECMYFGNLTNIDVLSMDVESKQRIIRQTTLCETLCNNQAVPTFEECVLDV